MEVFQNGIRLLTDGGRFPLGTDSMLLADFLTLPKGARVADLGSGCGALGLLLCARAADCAVTGFELNEAAHAAALENIRENALEARLSSVLADVRDYRALPMGGFDCVISNPPYFAVGSGAVSAEAAMARSEEYLPLAKLCEAAAWLLTYGGRFALVHRPERLCDIFCELRRVGLEPKRIRFVRHKPSAPVCLVLIEGRRGGKPGLTYGPDLIEFTEDGAETEEYRAIYHRGE